MFQSFEHAEWKSNSKNFVLLIIGIYRPPYSERHRVTQAMFMNEFTDLLEQLSQRSEPMVLIGDFNLHVDNKSDCYTNKFMQCLHTFGFVQRVKYPTHIKGHIQDLIITRK
jgi:exonuclease III